MGSRLELNMPKCLVEVGGRRIIDYQLELLHSIESVRIVVGFMEEQVIEHVRRIRSDVVFVRNPEFRTTSNTHSLFLATRDLREAYFSIDGDLLIDPASFRAFLDACDGSRTVVGITASKTEEAVFVNLTPDGRSVARFARSPRTTHEWCGIACMSRVKMPERQSTFVYQVLEQDLPLAAQDILCYEVDTPDDLEFARKHFRPC